MEYTEVVVREMFCEKVFLNILQGSTLWEFVLNKVAGLH